MQSFTHSRHVHLIAHGCGAAARLISPRMPGLALDGAADGTGTDRGAAFGDAARRRTGVSSWDGTAAANVSRAPAELRVLLADAVRQLTDVIFFMSLMAACSSEVWRSASSARPPPVPPSLRWETRTFFFISASLLPSNSMDTTSGILLPAHLLLFLRICEYRYLNFSVCACPRGGRFFLFGAFVHACNRELSAPFFCVCF